jgi:hypothetical protein
MHLQKEIRASKKIFSVGICKTTDEKSMIRIRKSDYKSADPYSYPNVTDPQHWLKNVRKLRQEVSLIPVPLQSMCSVRLSVS